MKRKYYMRGIGIGILVATILFTCFYGKKKESISDNEIISRAKELGYVYVDQTSSVDHLEKLKEAQATAAASPQTENINKEAPDAPKEPNAPEEQ